jgi:hypothetical protein
MAKIEVVRALSVKQPWATDLINGEKPVEFRSWPIKELGPLLIVSSKNPRYYNRPLGCALGFVEIVSCKWNDDEQRYHWKVKNPIPLPKPIELPANATKMRLGVYNVLITPELRDVGTIYRKFCNLHGEPRGYAVPQKPNPVQQNFDIDADKRHEIASSLQATLKDFPKIEKTLLAFQKKVADIHLATGHEVKDVVDTFLYDVMIIEDVIKELVLEDRKKTRSKKA